MPTNWYAAWSDSAFWATNAPSGHFDTPSSLCPTALAETIRSVLVELPDRVIEVGTGEGILLAELGRMLPAARLDGVDLRPPAVSGGPADPRWWAGAWDTRTECWSGELTQLVGELSGRVLLIAIEWLDDLPCHVLGDGATELEDADRDWLDRWWPSGARREVGRTRDRAWAWWAARLPAGSTLVTVDYGHTLATRPAEGSFTGFRAGRAVTPTPEDADRTNLTAAVAVDSLAAEVEQLGCRRLALHQLMDLPEPASAGAGLDALTRRSQHAVLRDPARFGPFWLIAHQVAPQTDAHLISPRDQECTAGHHTQGEAACRGDAEWDAGTMTR